VQLQDFASHLIAYFIIEYEFICVPLLDATIITKKSLHLAIIAKKYQEYI